MEEGNLDELLRELKATEPTQLPKRKEPVHINEESVNQYILDNAARLIETGLDSVEAMRDVISQSYEAKDIEAYALLIKAVTDSMDTANKINLTNKKIRSAKELKTMDIEARRQLGPNQITNNTNVLVATRNEIIKGLMDAAITAVTVKQPDRHAVKVIDVTDSEE